MAHLAVFAPLQIIFATSFRPSNLPARGSDRGTVTASSLPASKAHPLPWDHRINNEFGAAIAMVSLAATLSSSDEVKGALRAVEQRLHNQAQVHRRLRMPSGAGYVDVSKYLQRLCRSEGKLSKPPGAHP